VIRMEPTKNLNKCFWKVHALVNISQTSIKLFRENADAIVISMPSKPSACGCEVEKVASSHKI